jgi:hypothetical protein
VLWADDSLAIMTGINPDAPIGTKLAFVSGASGCVPGRVRRLACRAAGRHCCVAGQRGAAAAAAAARASGEDSQQGRARSLARRDARACCVCVPRCLPCLRRSILLWHRSDNLAFAIIAGGSVAPGEGVECKIRGILQVRHCGAAPRRAALSWCARRSCGPRAC